MKQLTIAVLGTFDTKGAEHQFVAQRIAELGHRPLLIDVGTSGQATIVADVSRQQILALQQPLLQLSNDRGQAIEQMAACCRY